MTDPDRRASAAATASPCASSLHDLIVVGGGPAGYMAAITAAELGVARVLVLEGTPEPLQKVRISGGGRCNVTHACWDPRELVSHYPRGSRPLRGPFSRFACGDAIACSEEHGLTLVEESTTMFQQNRSERSFSVCRQQLGRRVFGSAPRPWFSRCAFSPRGGLCSRVAASSLYRRAA